MIRLVADWLWRLTVAAALAWIGWQLHQLREDVAQPPEDQVAAAPPAESQDGLDEVWQELERVTRKIDAMMVAMLQLKK